MHRIPGTCTHCVKQREKNCMQPIYIYVAKDKEQQKIDMENKNKEKKRIRNKIHQLKTSIKVYTNASEHLSWLELKVDKSFVTKRRSKRQKSERSENGNENATHTNRCGYIGIL